MNEFAAALLRLEVPFIAYSKAADFVGVTRRAVIQRVTARRLPLYLVPLPGGGVYQLVRVSDLVAWCEERQGSPRPGRRPRTPASAAARAAAAPGSAGQAEQLEAPADPQG